MASRRSSTGPPRRRSARPSSCAAARRRQRGESAETAGPSFLARSGAGRGVTVRVYEGVVGHQHELDDGRPLAPGPAFQYPGQAEREASVVAFLRLLPDGTVRASVTSTDAPGNHPDWETP